jgi:hypothetical protein
MKAKNNKLDQNFEVVFKIKYKHNYFRNQLFPQK